MPIGRCREAPHQLFSGATGAFWGGLAGFGLTSAVLYWAREYLLYLVKAGHIAVLAHLLDGKQIPGGRGQIDYASRIVKERFAESSVLFGVDQLVKASCACSTALPCGLPTSRRSPA
ncbi:MAG TPA: hypothetical protein VFS82_10300 [Lysobacter sp.]|nr:hypothetical protein [Lysobacter sp.]